MQADLLARGDLGQPGARPKRTPPDWDAFPGTTDPHELVNLATGPDDAGVFAAMLAELDTRLEAIGDIPQHDTAEVMDRIGAHE